MYKSVWYILETCIYIYLKVWWSRKCCICMPCGTLSNQTWIKCHYTTLHSCIYSLSIKLRDRFCLSKFIMKFWENTCLNFRCLSLLSSPSNLVLDYFQWRLSWSSRLSLNASNGLTHLINIQYIRTPMHGKVVILLVVVLLKHIAIKYCSAEIYCPV